MTEAVFTSTLPLGDVHCRASVSLPWRLQTPSPPPVLREGSQTGEKPQHRMRLGSTLGSLYIEETLDLYSTRRPLEYWSNHRSAYTDGTNATFMGESEIRAGRHVFSNSGVRSCLDGRRDIRSLLAILDRINPSFLCTGHHQVTQRKNILRSVRSFRS